MTFFLSIYVQDFDRGMGFTEPFAWISEATHQPVFTARIFSILQLANQRVFQGGGLKTLFLINFLHLASVAAALQSVQ
jgi:hypothetical protein